MERGSRWDETGEAEFKVAFDGSNRDKAHLAKEVVAFANSGGGRVIYGVDRHGHVVGLPAGSMTLLDPARVGDYVGRYVGDQRIELSVSTLTEGEAILVEIIVTGHNRPPVVMERPGTFGDRSRQDTLFEAGAVFVRRDTKACPARRADYERWLISAEERGERNAYELMRQVAERPRGTVIEFALPDTPGNRLDQAADRYRADPSKLLDADDLLGFASATDELDLSKPNVRQLLLQSGLRKRATLWWWVAELAPSREWLAGQLRSAIASTDRDVSDAGKPILEVAALLCPESFDELRSQLASSSRYAHFRQAAEAYPDTDAALSALRRRADRAAGACSREECGALIRSAAAAAPGDRSAARKVATASLARVLGRPHGGDV